MTNFALTGSMGDPGMLSELDKGFAKKNAAAMFFLVRPGKIGRIEGLEEALKVESVIGHHVSHKEGDIVEMFGTSDHVVIRIFLVAENERRIKEDLLRIQEAISIRNDKGEDMLLPNMDVEGIYSDINY